jgi:protein required for attachment to host cells
MEKGIPQNAWVVVADGEKALFLKNVTDGADPNLQVVRLEQRDNPANSEIATDAPGRMAASAGPRGTFAEADFHTLAKDRFASDLAGILYRNAHRGAYAALVLVAPPHVLGVLRKALHAEVRDRVIAELDKTLTHHPVTEIEKAVGAALG